MAKETAGAPWRASLKEGTLKGSFVSEEGIRLQLFVPVSPRLGALDAKSSKMRSPKRPKLQIQEAGSIIPPPEQLSL